MNWSLVETICRLLEPDERQAVLGDLAESGEKGIRALAAVAGLVVRRQLGLWRSWRPWVATLGLLPILPPVFFNVAWSIVRIMERHPWKNVPQSHQEIVLMLCSTTLLTGICSWAVGFVMASLARRAAVSAAVLLAVHALWGICHPQTASTPLEVACTGLFQLLLCLVPFAYGLRSGAVCGRLTPWRSLLLAAAALLLLIALLPLQWPGTRDLLVLAFFSWPVVYLMVMARWREPRTGQ
jgi:hypothetical protein